MKKIFCLVPRENWIVDRMGQEYYANSRHNVSCKKIEKDTDALWLLAGWCWNHIDPAILARFKVFCTEHHIVKSKFEKEKLSMFIERDKYVDHYLTYTEETKDFIKEYTNKKITIIPHWVNDKLWKVFDKKECKKLLGLPQEKFIISSFQRDTEGFDLKTPKLEKGPDIFVQKVLDISNFKDVHVLLGGWRRQFVMKELDKNKIPYTYIELADLETLNKMYCASDLYLVSSREEGGPQSIFETSCLGVPVMSTPAGQAVEVLSDKCIYGFKDDINQSMVENAINACKENIEKIKKYHIKNQIKIYDDFFEKNLL